jgi:hypothetical protein
MAAILATIPGHTTIKSRNYPIASTAAGLKSIVIENRKANDRCSNGHTRRHMAEPRQMNLAQTHGVFSMLAHSRELGFRNKRMTTKHPFHVAQKMVKVHSKGGGVYDVTFC